MTRFSDSELEELAELARTAFGDLIEDGSEDMSETLSLMFANGASEAELELAILEHDKTIDAQIRRRLVELLSPRRRLH